MNRKTIDVRPLQAKLASDPALAGVTLDKVRRVAPGSHAVCFAFRGQDPIVLRWYFGPDAEDAAGKEWSEMVRAARFMTGPDFRIAKPLSRSACGTVLMVEQAPGTSVLLKRRDIGARAWTDVVAGSGAWLGAYCAPTLQNDPPRFGYWIGQAGQSAAALPEGLAAPVMARLEMLAGRADLATWQTAVSHGDFSAGNILISDTGGYCGIDLGGSARLPVVKDVARFLATLSVQNSSLFSRTRLGVRRTEIAAALKGSGRERGGAAGPEAGFIRACGLNEAEIAQALPFFIGVELTSLAASKRARKISRMLRPARLRAWLRDTAV